MTPSSESLAKDRAGIIYLVINKINGKKYVGQTVYSLAHRKSGHVRRVKEGSISAFHASIRKHGIENFEFLVLEQCDNGEHLNRREEWWIQEIGCLSPRGYNLTPGGDCHEISDETKKKISIKAKGRKQSLEHRANNSAARKGPKGCNWGKHIPEETRLKMSESQKKSITPERRALFSALHKGKIVSAETRAKLSKSIKEALSRKPPGSLSAAHKGKPKPWLIGRKHTPETKAKMSAAMRGVPHRRKSSGENGQMGLNFD